MQDLTRSPIAHPPVARPAAALELLPPCPYCAGGTRADRTGARGSGPRIYGADPGGFVLCEQCRAPLFYRDIGGLA